MNTTDDYKLTAINTLSNLSKSLKDVPGVPGDDKLLKLINKKLIDLVKSLDVPTGTPIR